MAFTVILMANTALPCFPLPVTNDTLRMPISYIDSRCYKEAEKQQNLFNQSNRVHIMPQVIYALGGGHTLTNAF